MTAIEQAVLEKLRALPPDQQREVLDFAEFLQHRRNGTLPQPLTSLEGALAHGGAKAGEQKLAADRMRRFAGSVGSGDSRSADNDRIDADLARAYQATGDDDPPSA